MDTVIARRRAASGQGRSTDDFEILAHRTPGCAGLMFTSPGRIPMQTAGGEHACRAKPSQFFLGIKLDKRSVPPVEPQHVVVLPVAALSVTAPRGQPGGAIVELASHAEAVGRRYLR